VKRFVFEVIIEEGNDEYWEDLQKTTDMGIADVTSLVNEAIEERFNYNFSVALKKFEFER
jgi:hypothetical protein